MDILYITKTSPLADGGGGEERARHVTSGLASRGHDVTVLCGKTDPDLEKWVTHDECTFRHVKSALSFIFYFPTLSFYATRYLFALTSFPVLLWLLMKQDFDVIIENMTPYPSLSTFAANSFGVPIVAVQHEFYDRSCYQTYDPVTATIQVLVQNLLRLGNYAAVITPTTYVAERLDEYGVNGSQLVIVPNGVDVDKYQLPDINRNKNALITIGRLSKRKGQDTTLRAFQKVHRQIPEAHLHILGKGPAREDLEELALQLNIFDAVTFHGYASTRQKVRLMNESGLFIFASRQEGFGLVLLEAMAAGLPIVARKLPVYEDFFIQGEHGRLVSNQDPQRLADATVELLEDEQKMMDIQSTNTQAAQNFSWTTSVKRTEAVLSDVTNDNNKRYRI